MNLSYWEIKTWLTDIDFTIIGSGIVGLNTALELRNNYPKAKILILEKGILPQGASTKNAGFACFGSLSEIIDDLEQHTPEQVLNLVEKRIRGLALLRETVGDKNLDFKNYGGYELFLKENETLYQRCLESKDRINKLLKPLFREDVFSFQDNSFGFNHITNKLGFNQFEGQIDTGKMMLSLLKKTFDADIRILNNFEVEQIEEDSESVTIFSKQIQFKSSKVFIATNGFAGQLLNEDIKPARAQVLITKPIKNLKIKGTFHLDKGYYYFRNIDDRILFGGGRNLDFQGEETTIFGQTIQIQQKLEALLETTIIPDYTFEIDHRWSGIMGVGSKKHSIVKPLSNNTFCGVRLGGMGVAIGSIVGKELANLIE
jgi:glycine/D-amino acid oxidase-like deaminating enzyme